jgi:hypothetical protein
MVKSEATDREEEFNRQCSILIKKGYPALAGITDAAFMELIEPLRKVIKKTFVTPDHPQEGHIPFIIVIKRDIAPIEKTMPMIELQGIHGLVKLSPLVPNDFHTIDRVTIPESSAYILMDIDRGKETLNVRPSDALIQIESKHRSPLTIEEGIAILTQYPEFLKKNNCFSLLASRHTGDKKVPAIWINAKKQPTLGWCWDVNPHTWLGSASCNYRLGIKYY